VKVSGNYILGGQFFRVVNVFLESGGTTTLQQELHDFGGSVGEFNPLIEIIDTNTAVVVNDNIVYLWSRSGTTWTNFQTISSLSAVTLISVAMNTNKLLLSSSSNTYVFSRTSFGGNYSLSTTISNSNITSCCVNSRFIFVSTTSVIKVYDYTYTQVGTSESATLITTMSCNELVLVAGRPTFNSDVGNVYLCQIGDTVNPNEVLNKIELGTEDLTGLVANGRYYFQVDITNSVATVSSYYSDVFVIRNCNSYYADTNYRLTTPDNNNKRAIDITDLRITTNI